MNEKNENKTQTPRPPLSDAHREWLEHPITVGILAAIDARSIDFRERGLIVAARAFRDIAKLARGV